MDTLTFIAKLVEALAWPLAAVAIILVLRRPLSQLIPSIQRLRYGEVEIDFGVQVREAARLLEQDLPRSVSPPKEPQQLEHLTRLAQISPRAAVLESWLALEEAAIEVGRSRNFELTSRQLRSPILLGHYLEQAGILDESMLEVFHRLRNLRNAAAHASDFSIEPEAAIEYASLAMRLADHIRNG